MIYTLTVCLALNTWIDTCGRYIRLDFNTEERCRAELQEFKTQPAFSYGYCQQKVKK